MAHRPVDKETGRKRPVDEHQRGKLKRTQQKREWERRHGRKFR